jgi:hypothetical protein
MMDTLHLLGQLAMELATSGEAGKTWRTWCFVAVRLVSLFLPTLFLTISSLTLATLSPALATKFTIQVEFSILI